MTITDIVGYFAMIILVISFIPNKIKVVRSISCLGCILFIIYGFMLDNAWPVIITNGLIALIHIFHLTIKREN